MDHVKLTAQELDRVVRSFRFIDHRHDQMWPSFEMKLEYGRLTFRGTNLTSFVEVDAKILGHEGSFVAAAALNRFRAAAQAFRKSESVTITLAEGSLVFYDQRIRIVTPVREEAVPAMPKCPSQTDHFCLETDAYRELMPFACSDAGRSAVLQAVYYLDGEYVATDSYRMATVKVPGSADGQLLLPIEGAKVLCDQFPARVDVHVDENHLWANGEGVAVCTKLCVGDYPNYRNLLPDPEKSTTRVALGEGFYNAALAVYQLHSALRMDSSCPVVIEDAEDGENVRIRFSEYGTEVTYLVPGKYDGPSVAFNPVYLVSLFKGTNVNSLFGIDSLKPWGIDEEAAGYPAGTRRTRLIMPVRTR